MGSQFSNLQNLASSDRQNSSKNFFIYNSHRSSRRQIKIHQIPPEFRRRREMRSFVAAKSLSRFKDSGTQRTLMNLIPNHQFSLLKWILDLLEMGGLMAPQSLRRFEDLVTFLASVDFLAGIVGVPPHISGQHNQTQGDIAFFHFQLSWGVLSRALEIGEAGGLLGGFVGGGGELFGREGEEGVVGPHVGAKSFAIWESLEAELAIHQSFTKSEIGNAFCMYVRVWDASSCPSRVSLSLYKCGFLSLPLSLVIQALNL